jgi:hypothetical protein
LFFQTLPGMKVLRHRHVGALCVYLCATTSNLWQIVITRGDQIVATRAYSFFTEKAEVLSKRSARLKYKSCIKALHKKEEFIL